MTPKDDSERRGWERFFLRVEGGDNTCHVHDGNACEFTVLVKDISIGGVMCEFVDDGEGPPSLDEEQDLFFSKCNLKPWGKPRIYDIRITDDKHVMAIDLDSNNISESDIKKTLNDSGASEVNNKKFD